MSASHFVTLVSFAAAVVMAAALCARAGQWPCVALLAVLVAAVASTTYLELRSSDPDACLVWARRVLAAVLLVLAVVWGVWWLRPGDHQPTPPAHPVHTPDDFQDKMRYYAPFFLGDG